MGDIDYYGDVLYREIDFIIKIMKFDLKEINEKYFFGFIIQENKIECSMFEIRKIIDNFKELLDLKNIYFVFFYKFRNVEF